MGRTPQSDIALTPAERSKAYRERKSQQKRADEAAANRQRQEERNAFWDNADRERTAQAALPGIVAAWHLARTGKAASWQELRVWLAEQIEQAGSATADSVTVSHQVDARHGKASARTGKGDKVDHDGGFRDASSGRSGRHEIESVETLPMFKDEWGEFRDGFAPGEFSSRNIAVADIEQNAADWETRAALIADIIDLLAAQASAAVKSAVKPMHCPRCGAPGQHSGFLFAEFDDAGNFTRYATEKEPAGAKEILCCFVRGCWTNFRADGQPYDQKAHSERWKRFDGPNGPYGREPEGRHN